MAESNALLQLVTALQRLPGVGVKSAQRMAYHLLQRDRDGALMLAQTLNNAVDKVGYCQRCHTFAEAALCDICVDTRRDARLLCIVESPADLAAMERTAAYRGYYFVLQARLSPLAGMGLEALGLDGLRQRLTLTDTQAQVEEVIMATNFTAEGEASAHVITQFVKAMGIRVTRLARGVPIGSELEYVDLGTIAHALSDRH